ncbi:MAG TPA: heparan-alpha-glucosaminide N-acetyltransferase domain-containing protein [Mucilaginibacter sp.]|nr:heparan-alpha-glucosaminide N-acetyltransferase domain-containing protein [Mucilaginibacter sp.]
MNPPKTLKYRVESIDILRGLIMLVMTLDHCREFIHFQGPKFEPTNMATTTVVLFFTRWFTHYCAPVFVFLSGVSAYLAGIKRSGNELAMFLMKRGLWLIVADAIVISFMFNLDPSFKGIILEVLWAIGGSMIILGLLKLLRAPLWLISTVGGIIFFGHNLTNLVQLPQTGAGSILLRVFLTAPAVFAPTANHLILEAYAVLPWTGVMLIGYTFGSFYRDAFDALRRRKILLIAGIALTGLFILLRLINAYGDPATWSPQRNGMHTLLSFLNTTKYPPSLMYLCMTLGPALMILSWVEGGQNKFAAACRVYGGVPFFYFVVHLYLVRLIYIILTAVSGINIFSVKSPEAPFVAQAPGFGYPLWVVYLVWILVIVILYFPCRWYGNYKRTHRQWWLSYL